MSCRTLAMFFATLAFATLASAEPKLLFPGALDSQEPSSTAGAAPPPENARILALVATGSAQFDQGRYVEAVATYRQALALQPGDPILGRHLGTALHAAGEYAEAEPLLRQDLANNEKTLDPNHPDMARSLNGLGQLLLATERLAEAETVQRRALASAERSLKPQDPELGIYLNNLALALLGSDRATEAEPLLRRALAL